MIEYILNPFLKHVGFTLIGVALVILVLNGASFSASSDAEAVVNATRNNVALAVSAGLFIVGAWIVFLQFRHDLKIKQHEIDTNLSTVGDLEETFQLLSKNYQILRNQTSMGFFTTNTFIGLGLIAILIGTFGEAFGFTTSGINIITGAGIITEFISLTTLAIFRNSFRQLTETTDKLHEAWKMLVALKQADDLPEEVKTTTKVDLITWFVGMRKEPSSP